RLLCRPMISATRSARPRSVSNVSVRMRSNGGCRTPASVADSSRLRSCWAKADGSPLALGEARWMRAQRGSIELRMVAVPDGPRTARATSSGAGCVTRTTRDPTSAVTSRATAASTTLSNDVTRRGILGSRYRRTSAYANAGLGVVLTHVVYSRHGRLASECCVRTVVVVMVQPLRERPTAFLVRPIELGIGPLGEQGLDEALGFAVGLGPVGADDLVTDLQGGDGF